MKSKLKKITTIATIFTLTVLLTNMPTSNLNLTYANQFESKLANNKLSNLQNIYFELCKAKEEKKDLNHRDIYNIVGKLPVTRTSNTKWAKSDIYQCNNENLKIGYSNDKKEKIEYIAYSINNSNDNINSVQLHYLDIKNYENKLGLVLSTKSYELDKMLQVTNVQITDNNLYKTYSKIIKSVESNKNTNKKDILNINKDFKQTYNDDESILEIVNNQKEKLRVNLDKNNEIETIKLLDKYENEQIVTYVKYEPDVDFLSAYNMEKNDTFTVLSPDQYNVDTAKDTFIKVINMNR
ncbi:hypothetical protein QOZ83_16455 [Romboutsia sedimentorum]|uniref:hypothetical protein n=1 Tax=Romboutsia sedimentorum TaxID=1368474 RepID=UPI0024DEE10E|nr:hypothetical protein [Romboutsia sedimentorum]MDK2587435.1 hypothetical protein [Romboutsia sedimentorum]